MHFHLATDSNSREQYLSAFMALVDQKRWFKRADQLASEMSRSRFLHKIVGDYHWLEMHLSHQWDVLQHDKTLQLDTVEPLVLAALDFAGMVVETHKRLEGQGRTALEGRLVDALKAETGFASLYLELSLAQKALDAGFDVRHSDAEGSARYDLLISRSGFTAEVECKSQSADAGRQIHRKDFYRFMTLVEPLLALSQTDEVFVITLTGRLSAHQHEQAPMVAAIRTMFETPSLSEVDGGRFRIHRCPIDEVVADTTSDHTIYRDLKAAFGQNVHVAGGLGRAMRTLIAMRSKKEDDTSAPLLDAMRKAASQFSGKRPSFIAVQEHDIEAADLMLPHMRRRMGILSYALFGHYGAEHVNATVVTGFGAVVVRNGVVKVPAFSVPNPRPKHPASVDEADIFLRTMADQEFADAIGAPLPAPNISNLPFDP